MTDRLAGRLVRLLLGQHPLPWRIEYDWTVEVYDSNHSLIIKVMNDAEANELIDLAKSIRADDAAAAIEIEKLLEESDR